MLTEHHCNLFNRPFFQFAQMKQYCPEQIPAVKAAYKAAWQDWRETVNAAAQVLGAPFAPPHIERWCNGWQVRAHFFAFFKYAHYQDSAAILSLLLNRRRLTVSLDWHAHRADRSVYTLADYQNGFAALDRKRFADFEFWRDSEGEYADYITVSRVPENGLPLRDKQDFYCIGKHIAKENLADADAVAWIADTVRDLLPLYEACHIQMDK